MKAGVLLVDKPSGYTSFDVIAVLRGVLHERRLGHTGTLDPMATGVLPVLVGSATKAADILPENEKRYKASFATGFCTDTQDITGRVTHRTDTFPRTQEIQGVLPDFRGALMQTPPMYSAVSIGGKRLYELARQGIELEREPRRVDIYRLELSDYDPDTGKGSLEVSCSKGTYIRTLIDDIGKRLGCGAVMTALTRTYSQGFKLEDCLSLDEIKALSDPQSVLIPTERLFECYKAAHLGEKQAQMYKNGLRLDISRINMPDVPAGGVVRVYSPDEFLGLGKAMDDGTLKVYKNFWR